MRKKFLSWKLLEILLLIIFGLAPLLWFSSSQTILGHDAGLPIYPQVHFQDRLFSWTQRYAFGDDQVYALPGLFIHGLEALVSSTGLSVSWEQKVTFIFWFLLPGLTMFYFATKIEKKFSLRYMALPAAIFYMYNHFLLQGWFVAERTKFSLYAALPLLVALLFDWQEKRRSTLLTAIVISLVFFFLNGMASLPLFGGVIVVGIAFVIFYLIQFHNRIALLRLVTLAIISGLISLSLQAYWLLPYSDFVAHSYDQSVTFFGGVRGILGWIDYISENSSLINLLRLQGVPEWYQNPIHPYASLFLHNPFLVAVSMLIPVVAFAPLFLYKQLEVRKILLFLVFLALFSVIFIAGSHAPFGALYLLMIKFVPGFIAFRTPFYKFSPALWFSYALLVGFTLSYFLTKFEKISQLFTRAGYVFAVILIVLYSFPFLTGDFFNYMKNVRSMKTNLPSYVLDFAHWTQLPDQRNNRILMLPSPNPDGKVEAYKWGYWSLAPLSTLYSNASIINDSFYFTENEKQLLQNLYKKMRENDDDWKKVAQVLGINTIVLRNDFDWNLQGSLTEKPETYLSSLMSVGVRKIKTFGEWEVFSLDNVSTDRVKVTTKLQFFDGLGTEIGSVLSLPDIDSTIPIYASDDFASKPERLFNTSSTYLIKPLCIMCNLQLKYINPAEYAPIITRDSIFYRYIKTKGPSMPLDGSIESLKSLTYDSYRDILELSRLIDERKSDVIIFDSARAYLASLQLIDEQLNKYYRSSNSLDETFLFEVVSVLRNEQIELAGFISKISGRYNGYEIFSFIQSGLNQVTDIRTNIESVVGITLDENIKNFSVISRMDGLFTLYFKPNDDHVSVDSLGIRLNDQEIPRMSESANKKGWYVVKNVQLHKGKNQLVILQPSYNIQGNDQNYTLQTNIRGNCFVSKDIIGNFGDVVKVTFSHRRLEGSEPFYVKFSSSSEIKNFFDAQDQLRSSFTPVQYENTYILGKEPSYNLLICNRPAENPDNFSKSQIEIENLNIYKIAVPDVLFATHISDGHSVEVNSLKVDQTHYKAVVPDEKSVLLFDQSFDNKWKITGSNTDHFIVNGYANAWLVNSKGSVDITYSPQRLVRVGFVISIVSLVSIILYLMWRGLKYAIKK